MENPNEYFPLFSTPPQTDLLRDENKSGLMHFFPPQQKWCPFSPFKKGADGLEEDGNVDIKMAPALKSQEMNQTQFPQSNGLAQAGLSLMGWSLCSLK